MKAIRKPSRRAASRSTSPLRAKRAARPATRRSAAQRGVRRSAPRRTLRGRVMLVSAICLAAIGLAGCHRNSARDGDLVLSGNIEVVDAQLSFKTPGRVAERLLWEGDPVKTGQLVARLDDTEQKQSLDLRRAELAAAQAALAELEAGSRPQEIASAEAAVHSAEAQRDRTRLDFERAKDLLGRSVIAKSDFDAADAQRKVAEAQLAEANEHLKLVREGPRPETIQQAKARVEQARAAVALAETQLDNTRLLSPLTGVVLSHDVEAGEFVSAGTPVVTVADLAHVWVRTYVAETDLGRIRHGQHVTVRTEALPNKTFDGVIGFISSEAEFTPKTVQTTKERVKLVFRIKVDIDNPKDELKPGMPADVLIPPAS